MIFWFIIQTGIVTYAYKVCADALLRGFTVCGTIQLKHRAIIKMTMINSTNVLKESVETLVHLTQSRLRVVYSTAYTHIYSQDIIRLA